MPLYNMCRNQKETDPHVYDELVRRFDVSDVFSVPGRVADRHFDVLVSGEPIDITVSDDGKFVYKSRQADWFVGIPKIQHERAFHLPLFYQYWYTMDWFNTHRHRPVSERKFGVTALMSGPTGKHRLERADWLFRLSLLSRDIPVYANEKLCASAPSWARLIPVKVPLGRQAKYDFISRYTHHAAFENTQVTGYITEKILEPIACGTVPLYLGAPDIGDWLDSRAYINCNGKFPHEVQSQLEDYKAQQEFVLEKGLSVFTIPLSEMKLQLDRFADKIQQHKEHYASTIQSTAASDGDGLRLQEG